MTPTRTEAKALAKGMWEQVDGGSCSSCTSDALRVLAGVWPDVPWTEVYDEMRVEEDEA